MPDDQARLSEPSLPSRLRSEHWRARRKGVPGGFHRRNLRRLSSDWQKRYGHPIALVETFVDPERFEGTCYRAANWTEIGVTKGFGRSRLEFYQIHAKPKAIFVYRLVPEACEILCAPEMPPGWAPYERIAKPMEYPLSGRQTKSLLNALQEGLTDPRRYKRGRVHRKVSSIVAIATVAIIAGNNSYIDIGEFARSLNQNQLRGLRASRDRKTKKYIAPSESTIRRVIQRLNANELDKVVTQWLRSHLQDLGIAQLAIDGKCARTASKINGQTIQLFNGTTSSRCSEPTKPKNARRYSARAALPRQPPIKLKCKK